MINIKKKINTNNNLGPRVEICKSSIVEFKIINKKNIEEKKLLRNRIRKEIPLQKKN